MNWNILCLNIYWILVCFQDKGSLSLKVYPKSVILTAWLQIFAPWAKWLIRLRLALQELKNLKKNNSLLLTY